MTTPNLVHAVKRCCASSSISYALYICTLARVCLVSDKSLKATPSMPLQGRRQRVGVGVGREPADSLVRAIVEQVQYYMSADNLDKDQFLADLMTANAGAVPIARLAGFRKMQQLTANLPWVATALRRSPLLELCHGDQDVRPRRRYTMQEAQAMPLLPRDPAENGDDNALHEVVGAGASMVVCAGLSAVLDVGGGLGPRDDLPLYDLATDIPLPYAHHTGHKMRMDKYVAKYTQALRVGHPDYACLCRRCFNCGATEHMVNECPQPRNVSRIQANRNVCSRRSSSAQGYQRREHRNEASYIAGPCHDARQSRVAYGCSLPWRRLP